LRTALVRLAGVFGDFPQNEAFKDDSLHCLPLRLIQSTQGFLYQLLDLLNRRPWCCLSACFPDHRLIKISPILELSQQEIIPPIDARVIGELQKPHLKSASGRVKSSCRAVEFEENILGYLLGFSSIVDDSQCDRKHEAVVAIEEHREGISVASLNFNY
jgi:hypothetical protein